MKKKVFGIVLLVLAVLVLLQGNFGIPSLEGEIWPLIGIGFFAYQSVTSLLRRHYTVAVLMASLAVLIANHVYAILPIPNQSLFWASILIVLGVSMLTHANRTWNGNKWWKNGEKTILTDKEVAFGTGTFYKQDQELVEDEFEVGFGNAVIYVPQHWRVDLKVETFCGAAKADAPLEPTSKTLIIRGDVAFGKLEVVHVK